MYKKRKKIVKNISIKPTNLSLSLSLSTSLSLSFAEAPSFSLISFSSPPQKRYQPFLYQSDATGDTGPDDGADDDAGAFVVRKFKMSILVIIETIVVFSVTWPLPT